MKKNRDSMRIQVGAFVAIGMVLVLVVIFLLGSEKKLFERQYNLTARFADISGLRAGAPVQLAGINVGTVNNISFDEDINAKKVKLELLISHSFQKRIRENSEASIVGQGLLGDKMVFVSVGDPDSRVLKDGEEIKTQVAADLNQMMQKGKDLLASAEEGVKHINDILNEVKNGRGLLHGLIYDEKGQELVRNAQELTVSLDNASKRLEDILGKIDRGEGTIGALIADPSLFNDIKTLLGKANRNKLVKAVVRHTLKTKDEKLLKKE